MIEHLLYCAPAAEKRSTGTAEVRRGRQRQRTEARANVNAPK